MGSLMVEFTPAGDMLIRADAELQAALREQRSADPDHWDSEQLLHEVFESLVCNSEYEWCDPAHAGALTDAPMLAVFADEEPVPAGADLKMLRVSSRIDGVNYYQRPEKVWAYMDYQIRTPLEDLAEKGGCCFYAGSLNG